MTIRGRLYTAIAVVVAGLALTVGVAIWAMNGLGDHFDRVEQAGDARALALALKYDVTDFNGWQTAYGYDGGRSRPRYLVSFARFRSDLADARRELTRPSEQQLLDRIESAANDFARLDRRSWAALRAGRPEEVRRILLGPEIANFERAAGAAEDLAAFEDARTAAQDRAFTDARTEALRLLLGSAIIAAVVVFILLVTATDLARRAERALEEGEDAGPSPGF
jgi:hypothetical protein